MASPPNHIVDIPDRAEVILRIDGRLVRLTNLQKVFWNDPRRTKRDLLQYYADVAPYLLPHIENRAMVMKRFPDGAAGEHFYMKRIPTPHPDWIATCTIDHGKEGLIEYPMVQDLATLLWIINLGCIDLNPWYSRHDDVDRPDFLHFDLDPGIGAGFARVREAALRLRDFLEALGIPCWVKTTGSRGMHVYVPIRRGPTQKEVWSLAKAIALQLEQRHPRVITAEYRKAKRPEGTVNVDYNQNAWGRTLSSIYSVRPTARATVSVPLEWKEVEDGVELEDFRMDNVPRRLARVGDLWKPVLGTKRFNLAKFVEKLTQS